MPARLYQWARTTGKIWAEIVRGRRSLRARPENPTRRLAWRTRRPIHCDLDPRERTPGRWSGPAPGKNRRAAGSTPTALQRMVLDRASDGAQDLADLAAEEDQGDDRHDRDEGEDQCVLGEPLTLLVANEERRDECVQTSHVLFTSFPRVMTPRRYTRWGVRTAIPGTAGASTRPCLRCFQNTRGPLGLEVSAHRVPRPQGRRPRAAT